MKYKHIQAAHELRMWIQTGISAVATVVAIGATHPELVESIKSKFKPKKKVKIIVVDTNNVKEN